MTSVHVAISEVRDGTMYVPTEQANPTVVANRRAWLKTQGIPLESAVRVHISYEGDDFCRYRIVDATHKGEGMGNGYGEYADALITTTPGVALFLPVADCVATTLFDEEHGVVMVSHLGRHSLEQQGGARSVEFLVQQFRIDPAKLQVWLSPAPSKASYPIFKLDGQGMKEAVFEQLQHAGVQRENIIDMPIDTNEDDRYYSHSAFLKGLKTEDGRFAMVAVVSE